jgi:transcriptional regulator with XRE-family HTH domain
VAAAADCGVGGLKLEDGRSLAYRPCERLRRGRGWSQVRLAGIAGVGVAIVQGIEAGRISGLRVQTLWSVAQALGCSVVDLVPALAVRGSEGGRVQESGGAKRASGRARRELVRRTLGEMLREAGGRMRACDVVARMKERYGIPAYYTRQVRKEIGVEARHRGGRGLDAWEWVLSPQSSEADSSAASSSSSTRS